MADREDCAGDIGKVNDAVAKAANAVALTKMKRIAERIRQGEEPTISEASFAMKFTQSVQLASLIGWLEQLRDAMDTEEDSEKVQRFIDNMRDGGKR